MGTFMSAGNYVLVSKTVAVKLEFTRFSSEDLQKVKLFLCLTKHHAMKTY
jgi:hypothetical protein